MYACLLICPQKSFGKAVAEIDYSILLSDVMPRLGIPNFVLLDKNFVALPRSEQKTRVKELCESVGEVRNQMTTFKYIKGVKLGHGTCLNSEGLSIEALMKKHRLPPGFRLKAVCGTDGISKDEKTCLCNLSVKEPQILLLARKKFSTGKDLTDLFDEMVNGISALGASLKIGKVLFYSDDPSSMNWPMLEESFFPDPKTIR